MNEVVEQLRIDGIRKGLCQEWQNKLQGNLSIEEMAKLFLAGINFCIKVNHPQLAFMRKHFKGETDQYGVYIDKELPDEVVKNRETVVMNGDCDMCLMYNGYNVSSVYARHSSRAAITVFDHALVMIDVFDEATVAVAAIGDKARVYVNLYGDAKANCTGTGIKVVKHNKKTY
jgi:hypothetical protein